MRSTERLKALLRITAPIVQAPMAAAGDSRLAIAAIEGGALGSLACAMLSVDAIREQVAAVRVRVPGPLNLNFFCHVGATPTDAQRDRWHQLLDHYYRELSLESVAAPAPLRAPFDETHLAVVEELRPEVVSFHFGLPEARLVERVKALGAVVLSSATTVKEAVWLEARGVDAVIAQGAEAGGHRGMFLTDSAASQPGTMALVPQVVDAVRVPVIAAGGIGDGRGIAAAIALGAGGVQIGTAYLRCPESTITALHRVALASATEDATVLTNVLTGRPARSLRTRAIEELGPITNDAPPFPHAAADLAPLRAAAERRGSTDFSPLWSGQAPRFAREMGATELTRLLAKSAAERLAELGTV